MVYAGGSTFWSCGYKYSSPNYKAVVSQSINGGQNWTRHELYSGSQYAYIRAIAVDPNDADKVFALGYVNSSYTLFKTVNGGSSWSEITPTGFSGTPYDMVVHPTNPDRLAAASSSGLYTTTNGGLNWSKVTSSFSTSNNLYQSEDLYGLVISTTSGIWLWENWSGSPVHWGDNPGTVSINCAVACTDGQTMYAGTAGGAVWTSYYGLSTEENTYFEVLPARLSVSPNPVTGGLAALQFDLPLSGYTTVKVYGLSGRVLQTVSSEIMTAGLHELLLNTSDLVPGIYFTRVQSEGSSMSGRFVVSR